MIVHTCLLLKQVEIKWTGLLLYMATKDKGRTLFCTYGRYLQLLPKTTCMVDVTTPAYFHFTTTSQACLENL